MEHTYHLKNPYYRKTVNLCDYAHDIARVAAKHPVRLARVSNSEYTIEIKKDSGKTKNQIVRALGHNIASKTPLKKYVTQKPNKNELFVEKKPKKKKKK